MFGTASNPARMGQGQSAPADDRSLWLKIFGGEILTFYTAATIMKGRTRERTITSGKEAQFPLTGTASAEYHTPGQELLGNQFQSGERTISIDGLLTTSYGLPDIDQAMSHFDIRGPIAQDMGRALARVYDKNVMRSVILAARSPAVGPFPGGDVITDLALTNAGVIDGLAWIDAIRAAKIGKYNKNVPETEKFTLVVNANVFDAIKYAKNAQGFYIALHADYNPGTPNGGITNSVETIRIENVDIIRSNLLPNTDESADTSVFAKYRANYSTVSGLMFAADAVGTLQLLGVSMETFRDVRRQEDFMVAKTAVGHGTLRPECATIFQTA